MLKNSAIIFGLIMVLIGILGFVQSATPEGYLLGIFHVNFEHNIIHLATGIISILCGIASWEASRTFFRIFGVVYGLVALLGFYYGDQPIFGLIANNTADTLLHTAIALFALYLGFGSLEKTQFPS